ncbi:hypothetical protein [Legionella sp. CNM-4043-24]|uniref:hypothetical protein n=1 Tax=Legionella sp. CNM-4043-24 TaxID=3421646 RepID=UPI00403AE462
MSIDQNDLKKRQEKDRLEKEALEKQRQEEERAFLMQAASPSSPASLDLVGTEDEENTQDTQLQSIRIKAADSAWSSDWELMVEDYKKLYGEPAENNCLVFPTREAAISFLKEQATATPPRKFLAIELGPDGKPTGDNFFSCGNGTLYQGSLQQIQQQVQADLNKNPEDGNLKTGLDKITAELAKRNPTSRFKDRLHGEKNKDAAPDSDLSNDLDSQRPAQGAGSM